jgi:hypothetical protein
MEYLTPAKLAERAPAAQPLPKDRPEGLIDTALFVREIEKDLGHRPVMAVQGRPHTDIPKRGLAKRERQGRHLVVCAGPTGEATILLNSHTVRRKAWIGAGYYRSDPPLFLVGVALPLQRWRGYPAAIEELERYRTVLRTTRREMSARRCPAPEIDRLAEMVSKAAYLPDHKAIAAEQLIVFNGANTLYEVLWRMLELIVRGNVPAAEGERKVKPVKGPDALVHAGNAVFNVGALRLGDVVLPTYRKT